MSTALDTNVEKKARVHTSDIKCDQSNLDNRIVRPRPLSSRNHAHRNQRRKRGHRPRRSCPRVKSSRNTCLTQTISTTTTNIYPSHSQVATRLPLPVKTPTIPSLSTSPSTKPTTPPTYIQGCAKASGDLYFIYLLSSLAY